MRLYTKDELIKKLKKLASMGFVPNGRFGNHGGVGNTLEDFLEITENNLPIPNATEWELKTQKANTSSLTTLFHMEPSPRAVGFVSRVFLPLYGWPHQEAGNRYRVSEMSFRQTIHGLSYSDRGFIVQIDRVAKKILVSFNPIKVGERHSKWLTNVKRKVGLGELNPQPYWGFDNLEHTAGTKLLNCFYVKVQVKKENGKEFYWYNKVQMLQKFRVEGVLEALEKGVMLIDFDARTGHNHGTKFRLRRDYLPMLYEKVTTVIEP